MNKDEISINILPMNGSAKITQKFKKDAKISEVIDFYKASCESKNCSSDNKNEYIAISKGTKLIPNKTLLEYNIGDKFTIQILKRPKDFAVKVSKNPDDLKPKMDFDEFPYVLDNSKSELIISKGLNISGICKSPNCPVTNQKVISQIHCEEFDFIKDTEKILCPICRNLIVPLDYIFYNIKFTLTGKAYSNDTGDISSDNKTYDCTNRADKYYQFKTINDGIWVSLKFNLENQ